MLRQIRIILFIMEIVSIAPVGALGFLGLAVAGEKERLLTVSWGDVIYGRDGAPERGIVIGRLDDGARFIANTPADRDALEAFAAVENVGRRGRVSVRDGRGCFDPAGLARLA